ncbi:UNVERIFIED_CONTAM: phage integrase family protein [Lysinibacillus xylanilyticus]|uniref:tyrosine-type recombinase/integrase n=1 Tax=Lysinibacillus xylanilyticus TaxID=582475 RepID=UPI000B3143C2|nr:tyrosine-type recombinase/integrase [Lysinibacillus xylanilyticus]
MTLTDLKQLFDYLERSQSRFSIRNELMFKLLATTGLRRSELVSLTWEQVDLVNETIRIDRKGKKERILPLHPHLMPLLASYKASLRAYQIYQTEPVFLNNRKTLDPRGLHVIFKDMLKNAGLPPTRFTLHHLRHTFETLMLQQNKENVDLRTLQELLGHESITSTQVYTYVEFE